MLIKNSATLLCAIIITSVTFSDSFANYISSPYISAHAGYLFSDDEEGADEISGFTQNNKSGYSYGAALGGEFYHNFRAEAEFTYRRNKTEGFDSDPEPGLSATVYSYMANVLYDFKNLTNFTPYIGGGLGIAHTKFNDDNDNTSLTDTKPAYQGMAGIGYNINRHNTISAGYRYFAARDYENGPFTFSYDKHSVEAGYRFTF